HAVREPGDEPGRGGRPRVGGGAHPHPHRHAAQPRRPPRRAVLRPEVRPLIRRKPVSKRIEVNDLNVYYGDFLAVEGISLTIEPRTVTAFIGPSGCGKSTFIRTLNRMHEVIPGAWVRGEVLIDGNNLYGPGVDPVLVRRQVGMVFQRPNPFPTDRKSTRLNSSHVKISYAVFC